MYWCTWTETVKEKKKGIQHKNFEYLSGMIRIWLVISATGNRLPRSTHPDRVQVQNRWQMVFSGLSMRRSRKYTVIIDARTEETRNEGWRIEGIRRGTTHTKVKENEVVCEQGDFKGRNSWWRSVGPGHNFHLPFSIIIMKKTPDANPHIWNSRKGGGKSVILGQIGIGYRIRIRIRKKRGQDITLETDLGFKEETKKEKRNTEESA